MAAENFNYFNKANTLVNYLNNENNEAYSKNASPQLVKRYSLKSRINEQQTRTKYIDSSPLIYSTSQKTFNNSVCTRHPIQRNKTANPVCFDINSHSKLREDNNRGFKSSQTDGIGFPSCNAKNNVAPYIQVFDAAVKTHSDELGKNSNAISCQQIMSKLNHQQKCFRSRESLLINTNRTCSNGKPFESNSVYNNAISNQEIHEHYGNVNYCESAQLLSHRLLKQQQRHNYKQEHQPNAIQQFNHTTTQLPAQMIKNNIDHQLINKIYPHYMERLLITAASTNNNMKNIACVMPNQTSERNFSKNVSNNSSSSSIRESMTRIGEKNSNDNGTNSLFSPSMTQIEIKNESTYSLKEKEAFTNEIELNEQCLENDNLHTNNTTLVDVKNQESTKLQLTSSSSSSSLTTSIPIQPSSKPVVEEERTEFPRNESNEPKEVIFISSNHNPDSNTLHNDACKISKQFNTPENKISDDERLESKGIVYINIESSSTSKIVQKNDIVTVETKKSEGIDSKESDEIDFLLPQLSTKQHQDSFEKITTSIQTTDSDCLQLQSPRTFGTVKVATIKRNASMPPTKSPFLINPSSLFKIHEKQQEMDFFLKRTQQKNSMKFIDIKSKIKLFEKIKSSSQVNQMQQQTVMPSSVSMTFKASSNDFSPNFAGTSAQSIGLMKNPTNTKILVGSTTSISNSSTSVVNADNNGNGNHLTQTNSISKAKKNNCFKALNQVAAFENKSVNPETDSLQCELRQKKVLNDYYPPSVNVKEMKRLFDINRFQNISSSS